MQRNHPTHHTIAGASGILMLCIATACSGDAKTNSDATRNSTVSMDSAASASPMAASQSAATSAASAMSNAMLNDTSLVALIAMVDRSEAEIGQLAVTKATNAEVKAYARAMVSDHRADLTRITRLAANSKIMLPSSNAVVASGNVTSTSAGTLDTSRVGTGSTTTGAPSENRSTGGGTSSTNSTTVAEVRQSMMQTAQQLASQKGSAFDGAYMDAMVTGHQRVLDVLQQNASSATNAEVRMHVTNVQADVMKHLQRAKEIQQKLGSATASPNSPAK